MNIHMNIRGCIQKLIMKQKQATIREATQRVMAAEPTRLTHKIVIQLHLVTAWRPVRKLLDTPSYTTK